MSLRLQRGTSDGPPVRAGHPPSVHWSTTSRPLSCGAGPIRAGRATVATQGERVAKGVGRCWCLKVDQAGNARRQTQPDPSGLSIRRRHRRHYRPDGLKRHGGIAVKWEKSSPESASPRRTRERADHLNRHTRASRSKCITILRLHDAIASPYVC